MNPDRHRWLKLYKYFFDWRGFYYFIHPLPSQSTAIKIAALEQALNYGEQGLDLVIAGLNDESIEVQEQAIILLFLQYFGKVKS
jgi:hypothetical protein